MTYRYVGTAGGQNNYEVTLTLYEDCQNGQPNAIDEDNPAFLAVYKSSNKALVAFDTSLRFSPTMSIAVPLSAYDPCYAGSLPTCLIQKVFVANFSLPASSTESYIVSYQRCCLSAANFNLIDPTNQGMTLLCEIPPITNSSIRFLKFPQHIACINKLLQFDIPAIDTNGDSISYAFANSLNGGSTADIKPFPVSPPYDSIKYHSPASLSNPMGIAVGMSLDPKTGTISCIPDRIGTFMVAINCIEWRSGVAINKTLLQFQIVVNSCTGKVPVSGGGDVITIMGGSAQFHATGGIQYNWTGPTSLSDSTIADPTVLFSAPGVFKYVVTVKTATGCTAQDTVQVTVLDHSEIKMPNAFSPNGDQLNDVFKPESIGHCDIRYLRVFNRYGNQIYNGTTGWDGTYKGQLQDLGVYNWVLLYADDKGQMTTLKGNVTLVR